MRLALGLLLAASPFVAVAVMGVKTIGWKGTAGAFGLTALVVAVIAAGVFLAWGPA